MDADNSRLPLSVRRALERAEARERIEAEKAAQMAAREAKELGHPLVGQRMTVRRAFTMDGPKQDEVGSKRDEVEGLVGKVVRVYLPQDDAVLKLDDGREIEVPFPRLVPIAP